MLALVSQICVPDYLKIDDGVSLLRTLKNIFYEWSGKDFADLLG
jgi:hypothetical protein